MVYELDISGEAKADIIDCYNWYEVRREDLGQEFINEVEGMLSYIEKHPEHYQIKYRLSLIHI